jgi:hypothetical protein
MRRLVDSLLADRTVLIGTAGTATTVFLDRVHTVVGILVGLATLTYLFMKIRREMRR